MKHEIMEVEKERFSLKDSSQYLVQGTWAAEYVPEVFLDKEPVLEITDSYKDGQMEISIPIPEDAGQYKKLYIYPENRTCRNILLIILMLIWKHEDAW